MIDIGKTLENARFKKQISKVTLARSIHTSPSYIEALENNRFHDISVEETPRLIKEYAMAVGIKEDPLLLAYASWLSDNPIPLSKRRENQQKKGVFKKRNLGGFLLSMLALIILVGVIYLTYQQQEKIPLIKPPKEVTIYTGESSSSTTKESSTKTTTTTSEKNQIKEETSKEKAPEKTEEPVVPIVIEAAQLVQNNIVPVTIERKDSEEKLMVKITDGACWLQVVEDGKSIFQEVIPPNQEKEIPLGKDSQKVTVILGAASYASLKINQQDFPDLKAVGPNPITFDITMKK